MLLTCTLFHRPSISYVYDQHPEFAKVAAEFSELKFALEYKPKEPRNFSFQARAADTLLMAQETGLENVAFGTNDSGGGLDALDGFKESLTQIVARIREQTEAAVVLLTPPFMATREPSLIHPEHRLFAESIIQTQTKGTLASYAEAIRQVAREQDALLADIYREWVRLSETRVDTDLWLSNGLNHPDARGHRLAAQVILHLLLSVDLNRATE